MRVQGNFQKIFGNREAQSLAVVKNYCEIIGN